jgi:hypothetical protein
VTAFAMPLIVFKLTGSAVALGATAAMFIIALAFRLASPLSRAEGYLADESAAAK